MKQYYIIDAFTGQPFGDNPAKVVVEGTYYWRSTRGPRPTKSVHR